MASSYPGSLDTFATDKSGASSMAGHAVVHNDLADALNKIEAELGVNPSGSDATVVARLNGLVSGDSQLVLNVKDYGAAGDGTADDTAEIQAAIDAATDIDTLGIGSIIGNVVFLPRGVYKVTDTIVVKNYVRLCGGGYNTSMIIADSSFPTDTPVVKLGAGGGDSNGTKLEHLRVNCNDIAGSVGIYCDDLNEGSGVYWCEVRKFRDVGIYMTACANCGIHYTGAVASSSGGTACIHLETNAGVIHLQQLSNLMGVIADPTAVDAIRVEHSLFNAHTIHCEHVGNGFNLIDGYGGNISGMQGHSSVANLITMQTTFPGILTCSFIDKSGGTNLLNDLRRSVTDTTAMRPFWSVGLGNEVLKNP